MQTTDSSNSPNLIQWDSMDDSINSIPSSVVIKPAGSLLTAAPMEAFYDEFLYLSDLGLAFGEIIYGIMLYLRKDSLRHVGRVRASLAIFTIPMNSASLDINICLQNAAFVYDLGWQNQGIPRLEDSSVTRKNLLSLLHPKYPSQTAKFARKAATLAARAAKTIRRDVLPLLPQLQRHLDDYVAGYTDRATAKLERDKSWVPSILQDAVYGAADELPWKAARVVKLPWHLPTGIHLLQKLPGFLDTFEVHFRRLSEVDDQQLLELGYASHKDYYRLLEEHRIAYHATYDMMYIWRPAWLAFGYYPITHARRWMSNPHPPSLLRVPFMPSRI